MKSPGFKQQSIKAGSQRQVESQPGAIQELVDEEDVETPRMDVSAALKLDPNQQKEKVSFFEELRKQSFIMSVTSTNKMDREGKGVNVTDQ